MKNEWVVFIGLLILSSGCKGYAKYSIDKRPLNKIDTSLLGIWRAAEDTDRRNYIYVETNYDAHDHNSDDYRMGKYKEFEDYYYLTYMNRHGRSKVYEQW